MSAIFLVLCACFDVWIDINVIRQVLAFNHLSKEHVFFRIANPINYHSHTRIKWVCLSQAFHKADKDLWFPRLLQMQ